MPIYDPTKPSISQDMLAFEASIREHFDAARVGHSSYWSSTAFLQTANYTGGGTAIGIGAAPQPYTRLLVNVASDRNLWVRDNTGLTIEAANNAGTANVPLKVIASEVQIGWRVGIVSMPDQYWPLDVNATGTNGLRVYSLVSGFKKGLEITWAGGTEDNRILSYDRSSGQYQHLTLTAYNHAFLNPNGDTASYGGGIGVRFYANVHTVPSSNPVSGALHWVENGASKARGSSGTVTTYAPADPHCPVCGGDFVLEQYNPTTGRYLSVCWDCWAEEKGARNWIIRRSRSPRVTLSVTETLTRKLEREAEADAMLAPPIEGTSPVTPVFVPPTDPVTVTSTSIQEIST